MRSFRYQPEMWRPVRNLVLLRTAPIVILALSVGLWIGVPTDNDVLLIAAGGAALAMSFGIYRGIRIARRGWDSFEVILSPDGITRRQAGLPEINIPRESVQLISEAPGKFVTVVGTDARTPLVVTYRIEQYAAFVAALREWNIPFHPVQPSRMPITFLAVCATIGLMAVAYKADGIVGAVACFALGIGLIWCRRSIRQSKLIDEHIKRKSFGVWLVIAAVLIRGVYLLLGVFQ